MCPTAAECPECFSEMFTRSTVVVVPACRHSVSLRELDQGLSAIYEFDHSGNLIALKSDILEIPPTPRCHCGSVVEINRYATIEQLRNIINTFDRLLAKMGRNLNQFAERTHQCEVILEDTFGIFCHNIRPDCLAANMNKQSLSARGKRLENIQDQIVSFRDDVVQPFENSMKALHNSFPLVVQEYALIFQLRFDLLEFRARIAWVYDSIRSVRFLSGLIDASNEVQRLAQVLRGSVVAECVRSIAYCEQRLPLVNSPRLEVEVRLAQILFKYLLDSALMGGKLTIDAEVTSPVEGRQTTAVTDSQKLGSDITLTFTGQNANSSLNSAIKLCKMYPNTAGRFLNVANELKSYRCTPDVTILPRPWTKRSSASEKAWGSHILGQLKMCETGHPYSSGSFPEGCPECGKRVELPEVEYARSAQFLHEDEFLAMMNGGPA